MRVSLVAWLWLGTLGPPAEAGRDARERPLRLRDLESERAEVEDRRPFPKRGPTRSLAIHRLQTFLAYTAKGPVRAEVLRRLAELHDEEARTLEAADPARARELRESRVIPLYERILAHHPEARRIDEVRFFLAEALDDVGRRDDAWAMYRSLVRDHPMSPWTPDALATLGVDGSAWDGPDRLLQVASRWVRQRRFADALPLLAELIDRDPASAEAELAARLTLDALAAQRRWRTLRARARAFHEHDTLGGATFEPDVLAVYAQAWLKDIETRDDGPSAKAEAYEAVFDELEGFVPVTRVLHLAADHYRRAGRLDDARRIDSVRAARAPTERASETATHHPRRTD